MVMVVMVVDKSPVECPPDANLEVRSLPEGCCRWELQLS